jgi:hemolysin III
VSSAATAPDGRARPPARPATPTSRPRLRGWSHLAATVPAIVGTAVLVGLAHGETGRQLGLLVYGAASVLLFATSGVYHVGTWSPAVRARLRRLDHANIFILIAGTYTPVTLTLLSGAWKVAIISVVWGLAAAGVGIVVSPLHVPRWLLAACYVAIGWVAIIALPVIAAAAGPGPLLLIIGAGAMYSVGAVCYATRWPRLSPRWFGYHEVFHVLVIAANALFFTLMVVSVIPHDR